MKLPAPPVTWGYAALVVAFLALAALRLPYAEGLRYPTLLFERNPAMDLGGLVPRGLAQLDLPRLRRSMARIPTVRLLRETGNSVRIAGGQVLEWVVWGGKEPLMLFPNMEIWICAGLDPGVSQELERAAGTIAQYRKRLDAEGWTLVVVAVPAKLGIHRDLSRWPVREGSLVIRAEVAADRSDEVHAFFLEALRRGKVAAVDLQTAYRDEIARRPGVLLYPPGDTHWSGEGIRIAAEATTAEIARLTPLRARTPVDPTYFEYDYVPDLAAAFDPLAAFTSRLGPVWKFHERLINGEAGRGYVYPSRPEGLVVALGTSYTGQYVGLGQPIAFPSQLGLRLRDTEVQNRAEAGQGSFRAFEHFWQQRDEIAREFGSRHATSSPRVVVWEFPMRDVRGINAAPPLP